MLLLLLSRFSRIQLCETPQMAAHQAPPSLGLSRQEHRSGLPFPSPMHESEKGKWSHSVVSDSWPPHGLQPTKLLHPWDFPGKSTGVGCHYKKWALDKYLLNNELKLLARLGYENKSWLTLQPGLLTFYEMLMPKLAKHLPPDSEGRRHSWKSWVVLLEAPSWPQTSIPLTCFLGYITKTFQKEEFGKGVQHPYQKYVPTADKQKQLGRSGLILHPRWAVSALGLRVVVCQGRKGPEKDAVWWEHGGPERWSSLIKTAQPCCGKTRTGVQASRPRLPATTSLNTQAFKIIRAQNQSSTKLSKSPWALPQFLLRTKSLRGKQY